ncbi:MAG: hypothetical protein ACD_22C00166G0013 [uncultured bacterium]|nr:MAG: hypothetical protein ACD_22C00166G0013 [uncultured bacterium]
MVINLYFNIIYCTKIVPLASRAHITYSSHSNTLFANNNIIKKKYTRKLQHYPQFELSELKENEIIKFIDSWRWCREEINKRVTMILKNGLRGKFEKSYKMNFNGTDIQKGMIYITSNELVYLSWWSNA